jgi:hypothetical protein
MAGHSSRTRAIVLIITHVLTQRRSLIPLKANENPAIYSPSPRFGERGEGSKTKMLWVKMRMKSVLGVERII